MKRSTPIAACKTRLKHWSTHQHKIKAIARGVLICWVIALAATFIADHYGGPVLLYALLFGMTIHFLNDHENCQSGIDFASKPILRFGVALLGARITIEQVSSLGAIPVLMVISAVVITLLIGLLFAKLLGLTKEFGLLTGGAVAICGASAALALSAVLPRDQHSERNTILTVVAVTTLSTLAMVIYPVIAGLLQMTHTQAGIFLGATIHDVAQVVGAGYMVSEETGDISTIVKLLRVAMLVPVVMLFVWLFRKQAENSGQQRSTAILPPFLIGFIGLVVLNSLGLLPTILTDSMSTLSRWCLVIAIAALGIKTSFQKLSIVGWRPILLMVSETLLLMLFVIVIVLFLR